MLKIEQNWGKIANYLPPNAQQRSAPLVSMMPKVEINYQLVQENASQLM